VSVCLSHAGIVSKRLTLCTLVNRELLRGVSWGVFSIMGGATMGTGGQFFGHSMRSMAKLDVLPPKNVH